jgi:hypothetical protein
MSAAQDEGVRAGQAAALAFHLSPIAASGGAAYRRHGAGLPEELHITGWRVRRRGFRGHMPRSMPLRVANRPAMRCGFNIYCAFPLEAEDNWR